MDLVKEYDRNDRETLCMVLQKQKVSGKLVNAFATFYQESKECVHDRRKVLQIYEAHFKLLNAMSFPQESKACA